MCTQQTRHHKSASSVWSAAIFGAASLTLSFSPSAALAQNREDAFVQLESLGPPVEDAALSDIRGKFIRPESISYFGISMITSWQDEHGITTVARLVFNVDFLANGSGGPPRPRLLVGWVREGDLALDVTDSHEGYTPINPAQEILPVGGLGSTSGAAQANVLAGADNAALNRLNILLIPTSQVAQFDSNGLTSIDQTTTEHFADGDMLEFRLGANEIGLFMGANGGSDSTIQGVGGEFARLLQQTVLNSDGNSVLNSSSVVIGADMNGAAFDAVRATEALSSMKGHGF